MGLHGEAMVAPASSHDEGISPQKKTKKITKITGQSGRRLVEYFLVVSSVPRKTGEDDDNLTTIEASDQASGGSISTPRMGSPRRNGKEKETNNGPDDDFSFSVFSSSTGGNGMTDEDGYEFFDDFDFQPVITARYPLEDHGDNPLHESVTCFCHPVGGIRLRTEYSMPKVHYFVATGANGKQMYGTCLTLWESYIITSKKKTEQGLKIGDEDEDEEEIKEKKKEVFLPKCVIILSMHPYLVAFREYLTQLHRLSKMGEMNMPIERYIVNFCSEIPAPPPGSFEVQTQILDSTIKFWSPPYNQPIAWVSLPFSHLFECLDIENVITVWHCLALERQVLLTSTQMSLLTTCSEVLVSLLFPMRWSHAYIPVLPHFLIPILSAPMPYLCGITKINLAEALMDLSRDCVVVDLDKNLVTMGPSTPPLPPLPEFYMDQVSAKLEENVGVVFREARSLTKNDDFSERGQHLAPHVKMMADAMWESKLCLFDEAFHLSYTPEEARKNTLNGNDSSGLETNAGHVNNHSIPIRIMTRAEKDNLRKQSRWDAVQETFLDIFVFLLQHYRKFLVFPSKENEGSYGGAGFRSKEFIESQRYDTQGFLIELIGTQMFDDFVTKRLYGSGEADVTFFDMAVDQFLKNSGILASADVGGTIRKASGMSAKGRQSLLSFRSMISRAARGDSKAKKRAAVAKKVGPLLQSARVHRNLKTIVPPEPSQEGLPEDPLTQDMGNVVVTLVSDAFDDDISVNSASTGGTHSTRGTRSTARSGPRSPSRLYSASSYKSDPSQPEKNFVYTYQSFPGKFKEDLFGEPRPMPSAVIAEFDRQKEDAARFRRKASNGNSGGKKGRKQANINDQTLSKSGLPDKSSSPEVATFTLFFMCFTAVVGKELLDISHNPLLHVNDRTILTTYIHRALNLGSDGNDTSDESVMAESDIDGDTKDETDEESTVASTVVEDANDAAAKEDEEGGSIEEKKDDETTVADKEEDAFADAHESHSLEGSTIVTPTGVTDEKSGTENKNSESKEDNVVDAGNMLSPKTPNANNLTSSEMSSDEPRSRFRDTLSSLQIEEAKATAKAQLGLAFEMLTMMKNRGLIADPQAYQCLVDACGRCGDTERATELLGKMHEDGIVADGVVYSCLVSAFSADNAMRKIHGKADEDLPEWANSASVEMDWNKLQERSYIEMAKEKINAYRNGIDEENETDEMDPSEDVTSSSISSLLGGIRKKSSKLEQAPPRNVDPDDPSRNFFVSEGLLSQTMLGENLLEIVFPDISIDTDDERCPRCNTLLADDQVVDGWAPNDPQCYTTTCPNCTQKFVPRFCVQSTSPSFVGSRGPQSPLLCERLSPWVLQKEIHRVMSDREGIENLLDPDWREKEGKNSILWWNLVLSFMRYKFPFSFLLQGSFDQNLIAPTPADYD